jgi:hypothetical protein
MPSVTRDHDAIHLGLDVHKNTISAGVLEPGADNPVVDRISADEDAVRPTDRPVRRSGSGAGLLRGRPDRV